MVICLKIPFHPNQLTFGRDEVYFFFFFLILYALLLLNHNTSKSNFCVKLLSCKCNFFSRNFLGQLHRELPQNGVPKNQFFERLKLGCYFFFAISRYLTDKYFDIVWGCHSSLGTPPQMDPPKINFLTA